MIAAKAAAEVVWITGVSSGIGRALALKLTQAGRRVVASARRQEALEALAVECGGGVVALPLDAAVDRFVAGFDSDRFEIAFPRRFALLVKPLNMVPYPPYSHIVRSATRT